MSLIESFSPSICKVSLASASLNMVKSKKGRKGKIENVGIPLEMEDEVDIFHKGRDRISLNAEPEAPEDSLSEEDVDVYNLSESEDDGSDSDGNGRIADRKAFLFQDEPDKEVSQTVGTDVTTLEAS